MFSLTCVYEKKAVSLHIEIRKRYNQSKTNKVMKTNEIQSQAEKKSSKVFSIVFIGVWLLSLGGMIILNSII
jgi:hypothetical protein